MSHGYKAVGWNRQKKVYDITLWGGIFLFLIVYIVGSIILHPNINNNVETLLLRGLAMAALPSCMSSSLLDL